MDGMRDPPRHPSGRGVGGGADSRAEKEAVWVRHPPRLQCKASYPLSMSSRKRKVVQMPVKSGRMEYKASFVRVGRKR